MKTKNILRILFILIYVLLALHVSAETFYWYWIFPWFDMLTHFLGGMCLGLGVLWFFFMSGYVQKRPWSGRLGFIYTLLGILVIGGGWELYEVAVHLVLHTPFDMNYFADTSGDLIMDTLGALLVYGCYATCLMRRSNASL